jgi:uncharacterized membrane protein YeaQ/YmgE (transglycosylase-associated protein family)
MGHIIGTIIVGLIAGFLARWFAPSPTNPSGIILTCVLGIAGAFLATFLGQALGIYRADQNASFIGATVGAVILLVIWRLVEKARASA